MNITWVKSRNFAIMAATCLSTFTILNSVSASAAEPGSKWLPWMEFGGYYNTENASRGEVAIFLPVSQSSTDLLFIDARGKIFEGDAKEGNFALGYRHMHGSGFNLGAWIGADARTTDQDNGFWQLSGGFEALSHNIDLRINWYGPATEERAAGSTDFTKVHISGSNIVMTGGQEVALQGIDGEIGIRVPLELINLGSPDLTLRAYAGGFYFDNDLALEEVAGLKTRLELRVENIIPSITGSRLTAEYEFSYDDVRDDRHEFGARLRIPTSPDDSTLLASLTLQERRMIDGLERDTDIVTTRSKAETVEDALTGTDFDRVAQVTGGGSITTTSNTAGANSLLIVNGTIAGGQTVQANQTVQGGGSTIQVRGRRSGTVAGFKASGSKPTVTTGAGDIITLTGNNTHIAGLLIDGQATSADGISGGSDKSNIAITQNTLLGINSDGIFFEDRNDGIIIANNSIAAAAANNANGINFRNDNSNITITNNTITAFNDSIEIDNRNSNILIANNILTSRVGNGGETIEFGGENSDLTIRDNILTADDNAIEINQNNSSGTITGNMITTVNGVGIRLGVGASTGNNFTVTNNTFGAIGEAAIQIAHSSTVTIADNTFNGAIGTFLLDVDGVGNVLSGTGNTSAVAVTCQSGTFTGTVTVSGVVLQDGVAPCN